MRCSMRDSQNLRPVFFTSTPISQPKRSLAFTFTGNSPIPKINCKSRRLEIPEELVKYKNQIEHPISIFKVLGNEKISLGSVKTRGSSSRKQPAIHPPMVVISDSEEEDTIKEEITSLQKMFHSATAKKLIAKDMEMDQPKKDATKPIRNRNIVNPPQEGSLDTDGKKNLKRVSRVAAIIDEIMNDRQSTSTAPSPMIKVKTERGVNIIAEMWENERRCRRVTRSSALSSLNANAKREIYRRNTYVPNNLATGTLQNIGNMMETQEKPNTRRTRKTTLIKEEEKENNIKYGNVNKLEGVAKLELKPLKMNNVESEANVKKSPTNEQLTDYQKLNSNNTANIPLSIAGTFNKTSPVFYKQEEIKDNEWSPINDQNGVFVMKTFCVQSISNGFVKIKSKSVWNIHLQRPVIFHVADGRGVFTYNDSKNKLGPGHTVSIPSGFPCQILNTGIKKNLIISFTKFNGE